MKWTGKKFKIKACPLNDNELQIHPHTADFNVTLSLAGGYWWGLCLPERGPSFICFICHGKSQLTGPEGKLTLPRQLWPLHNAWRSHAFWNVDGPQPKRWLSPTTTLLSLSFLPALYFCAYKWVYCEWICLFSSAGWAACAPRWIHPSADHSWRCQVTPSIRSGIVITEWKVYSLVD